MSASENEGAKFRLSIITELKARGVRDVFLACVDGLKGFPEAMEAVFPETQVQLCLVHLPALLVLLRLVQGRFRKAAAPGASTYIRLPP
jgi:putative transposase